MTWLSRLSVAAVLAAGSSVFSVGTALAAPRADAPAAARVPASDPTTDEAGGDDVIVTGSRTGGRTVFTSDAPIDSFSAADIRRATKTDLLESLAVLVPSLDLPRQPGSSARIVRGPYLRGLSPGHTLVLVDGKRRHATSTLGVGGTSAAQSVDIALIPGAAVERMEVLRDGASAVYGSDAIAGVINVITRKDSSGTYASARYGTYGNDDGHTYSASIGRGFRLGETGHLYLTAQYDQRNRTFRGAPIPDNILFYFPLNAAGQQVLPRGALTAPTLPMGATRDPREATRNNLSSQINGESPYKTAAFSADLGLDLNDNLKLYQVSTFAWRDADLLNSFRLPLRNENVRAIYPNGFSPIRDQTETDFEVLTGLQGNFGTWNWDLSTTYGGNFAHIGAHDTLNPSYGLASKTNFYIGATQYKAWTTNLGVRRAFDVGFLSKPVQFAAGAEFRLEQFIVKPGEVQSYSCGGATVLDGPNKGLSLNTPSYCGAQAVFGYSPENAVNTTRNNKSLYSELSFNPVDPWSISVAGRFEDYSDFGTAWIGRASTRLEVTPAIALRGTVGNAFQAPTLATIAYKAQVNFGTYIAFSVPVNSAQALALGSKPLKPETSNNYSAGVVLTLADNIHLSVDAYQIDVKNRVSLSTTIRDAIYPGAGVLLQSVGIDKDQGINFFINAANTRSRGLEAVLDGTFDLHEDGRIRFALSGNYNRTKLTGLAETSPVLNAFNVPVFSLTDQRNLENRSPRFKGVGDVVWAVGKFEFNLRETYYGKTIRYGQPATVATTGPYAGMTDIGYDIGNIWSTDANIKFNVNEKYALTVSSSNLFAARPALKPGPLVSTIATYEYDESGPVGSGGAFFAVGVEARF